MTLKIWRVNIDRAVTTYDRFTRYIRAETAAEAEAIADKIADEANDDCPDDAGPGNFDDELGDWGVNDSAEAKPDEIDEVWNDDEEDEDADQD